MGCPASDYRRGKNPILVLGINMSEDQTAQQDDPYSALRKMTGALRSDLTFTRQIYQGEPVYMVHDPVSFKNFRFSTDDYRVAIGFSNQQMLGDVYKELVQKGTLADRSEEAFYKFVRQLHSMCLLTLPFNDGDSLFQRHEAITRSRARATVLRFLFVKIPLVNPDKFLTQTMPFFRWLFSPVFVFFWLIAFTAAGLVVFSRSTEFFEPLNGLLAAKNIPFLWLSLIGLKVWHELGHGFACKLYGGRVPEMGAMLLAGMPAAYVDASAAWSFRKRRNRLVVILGGMYFESIIAILSVFTWAFSTNALLSSCAFQLFVMAGIITIFFNANPLMRYDGYFILSELSGIQNLRSKATKQLHSFWKYIFLGLKTGDTSIRSGERLFLMLFALAASIYKQVLIITIAVVLSYKFPIVGLSLAVFHVGTTVFSLIKKVYHYLLFHEETSQIRFRSRMVAGAAAISLPLVLFVLPMPGGIRIPAVVGFEVENVVRMGAPGFLKTVYAKSGARVAAGDDLIDSDNVELDDQLIEKQIKLNVSMLKSQSAYADDFENVARFKPVIRQQREELLDSLSELQKLSVKSQQDGWIAKIIDNRQIGRMLKKGDEIATIVDGKPILRAWVNGEQLKATGISTGSKVHFRLPGSSFMTGKARIQRVQPATKKQMRSLAVTQVTGETIVVDPLTKNPLEKIFEVQMAIEDHSLRNIQSNREWMQLGGGASIRLDRNKESLGSWIVRRIRSFVQKVTVNG